MSEKATRSPKDGAECGRVSRLRAAAAIGGGAVLVAGRNVGRVSGEAEAHGASGVRVARAGAEKDGDEQQREQRDVHERAPGECRPEGGVLAQVP